MSWHFIVCNSRPNGWRYHLYSCRKVSGLSTIKNVMLVTGRITAGDGKRFPGGSIGGNNNEGGHFLERIDWLRRWFSTEIAHRRQRCHKVSSSGIIPTSRGATNADNHFISLEHAAQVCRKLNGILPSMRWYMLENIWVCERGRIRGRIIWWDKLQSR